MCLKKKTQFTDLDLFWLFEGKGFSWLFSEEILASAGFIEKTVNTIAIIIIT